MSAGVSARTGPENPNTGSFCGHCGEPDDGGTRQASDPHLRCREQLELEPPRYCGYCRRRMKVQVTPLGWTAQCARHGVFVQ